MREVDNDAAGKRIKWMIESTKMLHTWVGVLEEKPNLKFGYHYFYCTVARVHNKALRGSKSTALIYLSKTPSSRGMFELVSTILGNNLYGIHGRTRSLRSNRWSRNSTYISEYGSIDIVRGGISMHHTVLKKERHKWTYATFPRVVFSKVF